MFFAEISFYYFNTGMAGCVCLRSDCKVRQTSMAKKAGLSKSTITQARNQEYYS